VESTPLTWDVYNDIENPDVITMSYPTKSITLTQGESIPANFKPDTSGPIGLFSISPQPTDFSFDTSTGQFSGIVSVSGPRTFTVSVVSANDSSIVVSDTITVTLNTTRQFTNLTPDDGMNGEYITTQSYTTFKHFFTTTNAGVYNFFLKTNSNASIEEWITNLYKKDQTTNLLTTATNLSNVSLHNGTVSLSSNMNNTSSIPNFSVSLEAGRYFLECVSVYNDINETDPTIDEMDVGIYIEKDSIPVNIDQDSFSHTRPPLDITRNSFSITTPIKSSDIRIRLLTPLNAAFSNFLLPSYSLIPGTNSFTFEKSISNLLTTAVLFSNFNFNRGVSITNTVPISGAAPPLGHITPSGDASNLSLTFNPYMWPLITSSQGKLQLFNGNTWIDTIRAFTSPNNSMFFSMTDSVNSTINLEFVTSKYTKARIVHSSAGNVPLTQELDITSYTSSAPVLPTINISGDAGSLRTIRFRANAQGSVSPQISTDQINWSIYSNIVLDTVEGQLIGTLTSNFDSPNIQYVRYVNSADGTPATNVLTIPAYTTPNTPPPASINRSFYNLIPDTEIDGTTPLTNPGLVDGIRYFRHSFNIDTDGTYNVFTATSFVADEEVITYIYKNGLTANLLTGLTLGDNMISGTAKDYGQGTIEGIRRISVSSNKSPTPDFTLSLTTGTYYIIAATTYNDKGSDLSISLEGPSPSTTVQTFTYVQTSNTAITP